MGNAQLSAHTAPNDAAVAAVPMRFEVTEVPVADVDRAKAFYQSLGWRLDADVPMDDHARGAVHAAGLAGFDHRRKGHDVDDAGFRAGSDARRRRHRRRPRGADQPVLQEVKERLPGRV